MFNFLAKDDSRIKEDVINELMWDPSVNSSDITVNTKDGIVTLTGTVPHYFEKSIAEKAAQRVGGVKGIADEMKVNIDGVFKRSDEELIKAANNALEWSSQIPDGIQVSASNGWVTLRGEAAWDFQRNAARDAVSYLIGVRGVTNEIKLKTRVKSSDIKTRIEEAFKRTAQTEGGNIKVEVAGDMVTLSGKVNSLAEIQDARIAAWKAPGVTSVKNNLRLVY